MTERNDHMDEIERIAANANREQRTTPAPVEKLNVTVKVGEDHPEVEVVFLRDVEDTWSIHVGPGMYMAVRRPEQGVVVSRLVEMITEQYRAVVFDQDGTEHDHE